MAAFPLILAVVPDLSDGRRKCGRVIVDPKNRKRLEAPLKQRLTVIEKKLQDIYTPID